MNRIITMSATVVVLLLLGLQPANSLPGTISNDFDDIGHGQEIGDSQPGASYNAGVRTLCRPSYNHQWFPPSSGDCVAYQYGMNQIHITFDQPAIGAVTFDVATAGYSVVSVTGFDIFGTEVAGDDDCTSAIGETAPCGITSALPLASVHITGTTSTWVIDTVSFNGLPL